MDNQEKEFLDDTEIDDIKPTKKIKWAKITTSSKYKS